MAEGSQRRYVHSLGERVLRRYSRQIAVAGISTAGQAALCRARALVVGAGGLGSPVLMYLCSAGVGTVGVSDFDTVEESNLQRQVIHSEAGLGAEKVRSAAEHLRRMSSHVAVETHGRVTEASADAAVAGYDIVVDCTDDVRTRYVLSDACARRGVPLVCASCLRWEGEVYVFNGGPCYRCLYPSPRADAPSCDDVGVVGAVCGIIGSMAAAEAVKVLSGAEGRGSRMYVYNAYSNEFLRVRTRARSGSCAACAGGEVGAVRGAAPEEAPAGEGESLEWEEVAGNMDRYLLVDVRPRPHSEMSTIRGSEAYPAGEIMSDPETARFYFAKRERESGRRPVLFCRRGAVSRRVARALGVLDVAGGLERYRRDVDPGFPLF